MENRRLQFGSRHLLGGVTAVAVVLGAILALGPPVIPVAVWMAFSAVVGALGHGLRGGLPPQIPAGTNSDCSLR